jgi:hypothetical protein
MSPATRILVISPSNLRSDPRVFRQLSLLHRSCQLTAAGYQNPELEGVEFIQLAPRLGTWCVRLRRVSLLLARLYDTYHRQLEFVVAARAALRHGDFDVIIANDADSWPIGLELRRRGRVLFDAHEYAPCEFEDKWWWRLLFKPYKSNLCRRFLKHGDGWLTVCPGIADEYDRVFGVRPLVVMNVPAKQDFIPASTEPGRVRMIHHGGATRSRKIENMIRLFDHLDERFSLDLMLVPSDAGYVDELKTLAQGRKNVRFLDPVPMLEIPRRINQYDLGLYLLEPNSFNNRHALPNKFFEFIQARLAIAIGPSPEMARLVREYDCGVVATDFTPRALAAALAPITAAQLDAWKQNAHRAADVLCWERESEILRAEIDRLLALGPCVA